MPDVASPPRSERRFVTCLFADVAGSTHLAETMDPEDWTDIMSRAFTAMIAPIHEYDGYVARLMGDGLLALFGAPISHEDDPERAVLAGLGLLRAIAPMNSELAQRGLEFNVRVGINTGVAIVGMVGPDGAAEYTAMGDVVNVAARMEQTTAPGTLQIAHETYRHVSALFEADAIGAVAVKGKGEPVRSYRVRRRRTSGEVHELENPLVGRDAELEVLRRALAGVTAGHGAVVALSGPPGVGKRRLVKELRRENDDSDRPHAWWQAGGTSYDHAHPLGAVAARTTQLYGVEVGDSREKIRRAVVAVHADFDDALISTVVDAIHGGFSARHEGRDEDLLGGELHRKITHAFVGGMRAGAEQTPTVVVFDNVHWFDEASAALVSQAMLMAREVPILFLAMARPVHDTPGWRMLTDVDAALGDRFRWIEIGPLGEDETRTLVLADLGIEWMPRDIERQLYALSQGNPMYAVELARSLRRIGAVTGRNGRAEWDRSFRLDAAHFPSTLSSLMTARIDRLEAGPKSLLQTAAVVGHEFSLQLLADVAGQTASDLELDLKALLEDDLLEETSQFPERRVGFANEMLRQVAYDSILRRERRELHAKTAEAIVEAETRPDPHALAHHFRLAGDDRQAYAYSVRAGEEAIRLASYTDAATSLSHARDLISFPPGDPSEVARLVTMLGRAHELSGRHTVALAEYERLEREAIEYELPSLELEALVHQAVVKATFNEAYDPGGGRTIAERAKRLAMQLEDFETLAHVEWALVLLAMYGARDYSEAVAHGEAGLRLARVHGSKRNLAYLLHDTARAYSLAGHLEQGHDLAVEARSLWEALNEPAMVADAWAMEADYRVHRGELAAAQKAAEHVVEIGESIESDWLLAIAQGTFVTLDIEAGRYEDAIERFAVAESLARRAGMSEMLVEYLSYAALLDGLAGAPEAGLARLEGWDGPSPAAGAPARAWLLMQTGDLDAAIQALDSPEESAPPPLGLEQFFRAVALEVRLAAGEMGEVLRGAREFVAELVAEGRRLVLVDARYVMGLAQRELGKLDEAAETLGIALDEARTLGQRRNLWRIAAAHATTMLRCGAPGEAATSQAIARRELADIAAAFSDDEARRRFMAAPAVAAVLGGS